MKVSWVFDVGPAEIPAKQALHDNTSWAIERGMFGVPSFVVGDQVLWGHDAFGMVMDFLRDPTLFDDRRCGARISFRWASPVRKEIEFLRPARIQRAGSSRRSRSRRFAVDLLAYARAISAVWEACKSLKK